MKQWFIAAAIVAIATAGISLGMSEPKDKSVFVHSVYFWLKEDVTADQRSEFLKVLRDLERIKSVEALELGVPAGTPRDVVDNTYDVALLVYFKDNEGHDLYQADKIHKDAIEVFEDWIGDIQIYDAICQR